MKIKMKRAKARVPVTVDGRTHLVDKTVRNPVPVAPVQRGRWARRGVVGITVLTVVGAILWSAVAISQLLSAMAPLWVACVIAAVFDLSWVVCNLAEWLARHDRDKARLAQGMSWVFLAVSMTLIIAHGQMESTVAIGVAGSVVSALAKGLWLVTMKTLSPELDEETRGWITAEQNRTARMLAKLEQQIAVAYAEARVRDTRQALGLPDTDTQTTLSRVTDTQDKTVANTQDTTRHVKDAGTDRRDRPVPALEGRRNMSERARQLVAEGRSADEAKAVLRLEFPDELQGSRATAVRRAIEKAERAS